MFLAIDGHYRYTFQFSPQRLGVLEILNYQFQNIFSPSVGKGAKVHTPYVLEDEFSYISLKFYQFYLRELLYYSGDKPFFKVDFSITNIKTNF
ncbi:MAG: hypothetical protein Ct9H300mP28_05300 [Pseudomonadota bacterium]|nr:MAG: hypothetical protein Ct9H300mP28_05300 [Pseudomonadota bacterium]